MSITLRDIESTEDTAGCVDAVAKARMERRESESRVPRLITYRSLVRLRTIT